MRRYAVIPGLLLVLTLTIPVTAGQPLPADTCGSCHRDIYRMWRDSAHAQSLEDPFFLEPLHRVRATHGTQKTQICLDCHAPLARLVGDSDLEMAISREGVNCEFCHGLVDVEIEDGVTRHRVAIGDVKYGTIPHAESQAHEVAYSELHADSLLCAPCHEYATPDGISIMSTYSEWSASNSAERGEQCQSCHMNLVESDVVDPRVKRESGAQVNLHEMPGAHSLSQLHKALRVQMHPKRTDDSLRVAVDLDNRGAGHAVPTGMPGRRIVLSVDVRTSDGQSFHEERSFEKRFVDEEGTRVDNVADHFFARGLRLESDSRIAADEIRRESFDFALSGHATAWVTVKLEYEHAPWGPNDERVSLTFFSENRLLRR